ncbi:MICOS complex subunit mic25a isoform X2 [Belonocnema kinseyi]|uniref:MICOS complex subunit mic25a isoform X2 n=1 Tax=Belonocnema kinseyi TaxID=2817044 RepID=UPI00143CE968|nr:MICOS complex subunit mic25a isoform X2 [Belonocnema kinseyi]
MGASQSAHKLTVTNEDEGEGVIQVSNAIVQRLKQGLQETSSVPEDVRVPSQSQRVKPVSPEGGVAPLPPGGGPPSGYPSYYYPEYTISAIQMQKQKEAELDEQDEYWKKRVLNLEKKHEQINNILECEYKKAVAEFTDDKSGCGNVLTPCIENSKKIAKCYEDHPKQALQCAPLVEEFSTCVDQCRMRILAGRC